MSDKVLAMVKISVNALRAYDIELAKTITKTEREVDQMYLAFIDKIADIKQTDGRCILSSAFVTRYLERIGDHAVYICESIVYVATGQKITLG
jgi:phosphate transport system protein